MIEQLTHETRFVIRIALRDMGKRLSAFAMILGVCVYAGATRGIVLLILAVFLSEVAARALARRLIPRGGLRLPHAHLDNSTAVPLRNAVMMWLVNVSSTAFYFLPAVMLAGAGTVPMLLAGCLWVFGCLVHLTNSYIALPLYNRSQFVPAAAVVLVTFWVAARTPAIHGTVAEWWITAALVAVYFANSIETLRAQKDTQDALDAARADAAARLRALERMSRQDPLTGLLNRRAFDEGLARWLAEPDADGRVAVLVIDLDDFKPINDSYSHAAGDAVLVTLAQRFTALTGARGMVARLGGDEFVIALRGVGSGDGAMSFAEILLREIEGPVRHADLVLRVSASVGIALSGPVLDTAPRLCAAADKAMFAAKEAGGGPALYDPRRHQARAGPEDRRLLAAAIRDGALRAHYQPKVRLDTGAVIGLEALARWHHPVRGLLMPAAFLPQINDLGLQAEFQTAILRQVVQDIAGLLAEGVDPGQISLNLSEATLATRSVINELEEVIASHPQVASHLTIEITEDLFLARAGEAIQASTAHLRGLGLRMALDDFGNGSAAFHHLRRLDFDEVKIDRGLVADLGRNDSAEVLVAGLIAIVRGLGLSVIAQGIETEEQRRILSRLGCTFGQGFHFHAVHPLAELRAILPRQAGQQIQHQEHGLRLLTFDGAEGPEIHLPPSQGPKTSQDRNLSPLVPRLGIDNAARQ